MGLFSACAAKPKPHAIKKPGGAGGFRHTGGIGFEGSKLVIAGLPEGTKKLFKEASKKKRKETGKGLTKRDVKHILKTYGAELRNPDALFAKASVLASAPAPPPAGAAPPIPSFGGGGPPPVPSFDSFAGASTPALPPIPALDPSLSGDGPPPVPNFDPSSFSATGPSVEQRKYAGSPLRNLISLAV